MSGSPRLEEKLVFSGTIAALSGVHVGTGDAGMVIGGADRLVVRDPRTNRPYLPGSSLKGKMRSLLEAAICAERACEGFLDGLAELRCGPCACGRCVVCALFGVPVSSAMRAGGLAAGRLLFRDALLANAEELDGWRGLEMPYTEVKAEASIDRLSAATVPRQLERVPAGARFDLSIVLNVFTGDPADEHLATVKQGLALLADDSLGGHSSRGYGEVEVRLEHLARIPIAAYADAALLREHRERNLLPKPIVYGRTLSEPG